jgi:hypothetical protein
MAFVIVARDRPVYELDVARRGEEATRLAHFILHGSLDMVDLAVWNNAATYLKVVDRHENQMVSAYVTHGGVRFLILHETRNEEGIRAFCSEVYELYVKVLLNPLYVPYSKIDNRDFDARVRALARRYLGFRGE